MGAINDIFIFLDFNRSIPFLKLSEGPIRGTIYSLSQGY